MNKVWMDFLTVQPGSGGQILVGSGLQRLCQDGGRKKSSAEQRCGGTGGSLRSVENGTSVK